MLVKMPDTIQNAWGEVAVRDFTIWLEAVMTERTVSQDAWGQAQGRFDAVEIRLTNVEKRLDAVEIRLTIVERELAELKVEVRELRREMNERFDRVIAMFNERFDRQAAEMNARFAQMSGRWRCSGRSSRSSWGSASSTGRCGSPPTRRLSSLRDCPKRPAFAWVDARRVNPRAPKQESPNGG